MDLLCYLHPGWNPVIRPGAPTRPWMDATPEAFAYRCLPLNIANSHGWEILCPCDVEAYWAGDAGASDVIVTKGRGCPGGPVSLFGQGILTFHIEALFRTPPGWDLWVGGSPNSPKDAISPLSGVVETDWSPYTFTMNWQFTRRNRRVRFAAGEPICFFYPVQRGVLESVQPSMLALDANPALAGQFGAWSQSRNDFQQSVLRSPPLAPSDRWQKRYYRGEPMPGGQPPADHRTRLRLRPFAHPDERTTPDDAPVARVPPKVPHACPALIG